MEAKTELGLKWHQSEILNGVQIGSCRHPPMIKVHAISCGFKIIQIKSNLMSVIKFYKIMADLI